MRAFASRILRAPLLHCLALGLAGAWLLGAGSARAPAVASVDDALYREARARGYHDLPAVRERLARLGAFLELAPADADPGTRRRAAVALGLDESDPVVRRYMIEAVRASLDLPPLDAPLRVGEDAPELDEATRARLRALGYVDE